MARHINAFDHVTARDNHIGGFRGVLEFGRGRHIVHYTDPFGNSNYRTVYDETLYRDENIVTIGAYQYVFDKLFNIGIDQDSTLRVGHLNDEAPMMKIGVNRDAYQSIHFNAETSVTDPSVGINPGINISANHFIFGFMMGDGGCKEDGSTPIAPKYTDRTLYHPVPFRMSNDGTVIDRTKYFGRSQSFAGNTIKTPVDSYYVKTFDDPKPHIVHAWATGKPNDISIVDDSVFASTSSIPIESYTEMNITVDLEDGHSYFTSTGSTPRVNEFGLIAGWYNPAVNDYESLILITHFTRPSIALTGGDAIEATYRLYGK